MSVGKSQVDLVRQLPRMQQQRVGRRLRVQWRIASLRRWALGSEACALPPRAPNRRLFQCGLLGIEWCGGELATAACSPETNNTAMLGLAVQALLPLQQSPSVHTQVRYTTLLASSDEQTLLGCRLDGGPKGGVAVA